MSEVVLCPRCLLNHYTPYGAVPTAEQMRAAPYPAMSRVADVYVCNWCGVHEAFMDMEGTPLPEPSKWPVATAHIGGR